MADRQPRIHNRFKQGRPSEEESIRFIDLPPVRYLLYFSLLVAILLAYNYFFRKPRLGEDMALRRMSGFQPARMPELTVDGRPIVNPKIDSGFKSVAARNQFQQRQLAVLRKYESVRFVGEKEREQWLDKIEKRNNTGFGKTMRGYMQRLNAGESTVALFNIESMLKENPRDQVEKETHLYAWQVLFDEYSRRGMKTEAQKALHNYFTLMQEVLPDATPGDQRILEEAVRKLE